VAKPKTADDAIRDGSQKEALNATAKMLKELPRESQVRVLACLAILFEIDEDVALRLSHVRRFR
jgi:hypothetical protein